MCITKTFVYDCSHKHLIRLHCPRNNPLLCHDLNNRVERRYYDCCCCIEYQLGVAEEERFEGGIRQWLNGVEGGDGENEHSMGGGYDSEHGRGEGVGGRGGGGKDRDRTPKANDAYQNRKTTKSTATNHNDQEQVLSHSPLQTDEYHGIDADGDVDMLANEGLEPEGPDYWSGAKMIKKPKKKQEGEDEEVWEGMGGGGFC
ncbi:hypothetical protein BKA64DRAFT_699032 [Cadophora sp. MPI-SDFR-AT-0126]|nr:hypothetical protein BKA64DRAFT_699032 [Leotiomycetes sp. MPI-SDFR-AT-0126]